MFSFGNSLRTLAFPGKFIPISKTFGNGGNNSSAEIIIPMAGSSLIIDKKTEVLQRLIYMLNINKHRITSVGEGAASNKRNLRLGTHLPIRAHQNPVRK